MIETNTDSLITGILPSIALDNMDKSWQETFQHSAAGKLWQYLYSQFTTCISLPKLGGFLQTLSFLFLLGLMLASGAPQFAGDKEGLAIFVSFATLFWVLGRLLGGKERYSVSAVDFLVIAFLFINIVATAASHYLAASIIGLAKVFVFICSYFIFRATLIQKQNRILYILAALLFTGFLVSLYGLYQYKIGVAPLATWEDPTVETKGIRIFSTLGNPNLLAAYLIPMVPIAVSLSVLSARSKHWILSTILLGAAGIFSVACLLTGSRGAYIGLLASALAYLPIVAIKAWRSYPKTRIAIIAAIIIAPLLLFIALHSIPSFEQRFASIFAGREHTSNSFRLNVWIASWKMFADNWWFGIGPGNKTFVLVYGLYMLSGFDALGTYCVPLEVAVETGIIGLLIFCALLVVNFTKAHLSFWRGQTFFERWLALGCASALVGMMAHGCVDTVFYRPQVQFIFWLLIACLTVIHCPASQTTKELSLKQSECNK